MSPPTLALLGDVMLGRGVSRELTEGAEPASLWGDVGPVLRESDAVIANLECAITRHTRMWSATPKVFHFRADPIAIDVLRAGNVRAVSLANNHVLDFEVAGLLETLDRLDTAGIARAGAGRDAEDAARPAVLDVAGRRVGLLAFTDNEPPFAAGPDTPGTNYLRIEPSADALRRVDEAIAAARDAGAELLVLSLHWGPNMVTAPPPAFRDFARAVIEHGVDLVHGHSAHVFQAVEVHAGRAILYDTGDFLDDYSVDRDLRNDWSFVFLADLDEGGAVNRLRLRPVRLHYARTELARGSEAAAIRRRMIEACAPFGTPVRETEDGLEIPVRAARC